MNPRTVQHTFYYACNGASHDNAKVSSCSWPGCDSLASLISVQPRMNVPFVATSVANCLIIVVQETGAAEYRRFCHTSSPPFIIF